MCARHHRYVPPVWKAPTDPTDMSQMPPSLIPWRPISVPPALAGSYGIVLPTGEPTAAAWNGVRWSNWSGEVKPIAWHSIRPDHST